MELLIEFYAQVITHLDMLLVKLISHLRVLDQMMFKI
jgi:hypothetical protein